MLFSEITEDLMAKKESKKAKEPKGKKKNKKEEIHEGVASAPGVPPTGAPGSVTSTSSVTMTTTGAASVPLSAMMPEQMSPAQLEQAIKESNDPSSQLKKLKSPISVKSCLFNILMLIVLTLVIVIVWCVIAVDKFNFVTVVKDMSWQFGITQGFQWLGAQISSWFH